MELCNVCLCGQNIYSFVRKLFRRLTILLLFVIWHWVFGGAVGHFHTKTYKIQMQTNVRWTHTHSCIHSFKIHSILIHTSIKFEAHVETNQMFVKCACVFFIVQFRFTNTNQNWNEFFFCKLCPIRIIRLYTRICVFESCYVMCCSVLDVSQCV